MATLRNKSTKLTVARAPKYDKQSTKSPSNRIQARRRVKRVDDKSNSMSNADVDIQINEGKIKVATSIELKWRQHESIAPHARRTHRSTQQADSINHTKLSCPFAT
jgi:hypothetical protein